MEFGISLSCSHWINLKDIRYVNVILSIKLKKLNSNILLSVFPGNSHVLFNVYPLWSSNNGFIETVVKSSVKIIFNLNFGDKFWSSNFFPINFQIEVERKRKRWRWCRVLLPIFHFRLISKNTIERNRVGKEREREREIMEKRDKGSSINDVMQIWKIYYAPSPHRHAFYY